MLLALTMVITMMPFGAFATDENAAAEAGKSSAAATDESAVTVTEDAAATDESTATVTEDVAAEKNEGVAADAEEGASAATDESAAAEEEDENAADEEADEEAGPSVPVPAEPENGIPLVVVNVDECELHIDEEGDAYGSIQDMNDSEDHSVRCTGSVDILIPEGYKGGYGDSVLSPDADTGKLQLSYIRGRGNSTWFVSKKPYKIKFKTAQDLFGMGSCKEWALMAAAWDITLMKNRIVSWLGEQMDMPFTPQMVPVDLVMKGSYGSETYLGTYYISELVDADENRVDIKKLKKNTTEETGENNISGGYLISLYNDSQDSDEPRNAVFKTDGGIEYYIRAPEYEGNDSSELTEGQNKQREYISRYIQHIEDLITEPDAIDEAAHNEIAGLLDLTSAADYWLIQEFTKNGDAYITGSTYLYKDRDGKLCFGPLWDFDGGLGSQNDETDNIADYEENTEGFNYTWFSWIAELREKDPLFTEFIKERWLVMNGKLEELTKDNGVIDQFRDEVAASQVKNGQIWPDDVFVAEDAEKYSLVIEKQKKWIDQRREWFNSNLDSIQKSTLTVTYSLDGTVIKTEKVRCNGNICDPPDAPVKDGKIFIGWYCEKMQLYAGEFTFLEDTEFTAQFIDEADEVIPSAIYLQRSEDWADLQDEIYLSMGDVRFVPQNVTIRDVIWSSSDENVAEVSDDGQVTLNSTGDAVITAMHHSGVSASYTLHVYDSEETKAEKITGVRADEKLTLETGQTTQIKWTLQPEGCVLQSTSVFFESGDESVAEVDAQGVVTAKSPGTAIISISIFSGSFDSDEDPQEFTAECEVTVKAKSDTEPDTEPDPEPDVKPDVTPDPKPDVKPDVTPDPEPVVKVIKPKGTKIRSLKKHSKAITVKWKKQSAKVASSHISGYQIQLATNKKFTKNKRTVTVKGYKTTSKKIKKLKGKRRYYVRIRTYKVLNGKRYYSSWSGRKSIKTKK